MPDRHTYRPKDEEAFSDYVKDHLVTDLTDRGIIVNREVQIRRGQGNARGEDTDIHIDAVTRGGAEETYDTITVIVEAKGCWHRELATAMETQLVNRYLKDNQCSHGLYLIGWFKSSSWDPMDPRERQVPSITLGEAKSKFSAQAIRLSQGELEIRAIVLDTSL